MLAIESVMRVPLVSANVDASGRRFLKDLQLGKDDDVVCTAALSVKATRTRMEVGIKVWGTSLSEISYHEDVTKPTSI